MGSKKEKNSGTRIPVARAKTPMSKAGEKTATTVTKPQEKEREDGHRFSFLGTSREEKEGHLSLRVEC